jgi:hypothetical protein
MVEFRSDVTTQTTNMNETGIKGKSFMVLPLHSVKFNCGDDLQGYNIHMKFHENKSNGS